MVERVLLVLVAVCFLVLPGYADDYASDEVAEVRAVEGKVTRDGQPVKISDAICDRDKLHVHAGASITLYFFVYDCHMEIIQGDSTFLVTVGGSKAPADKKNVGEPPTSMHDTYVGPPCPYTTTAHHSLSSTPELRWTPVEGAVWYRVSVFRKMGDNPFITQDVTETSLKLTEALDRGKTYVWKVEARTADGEEIGEDFRGVTILTSAQVHSVRNARAEFDQDRAKSPGRVSAYITMASRYRKEGLDDEAIGLLQMLSLMNPTDPYPHEWLSVLYQRVGMFDEAKKQQGRAGELGK